MPEVWDAVLSEIKKTIPRSAFLTWFQNLTLISIENKTATIGIPNIFFKKQLESKYSNEVLNSFRINNIDVNQVKYIIQSCTKKKIQAREITSTNTLSRLDPIKKIETNDLPTQLHSSSFKSNLNPKYTIDSFVIGSNNDLAVSVAKNVIEFPGTRYNPFFLYGGPGLGKTHLVQAIGNELLRSNPKLKVLYTPVNHFYSDFINSIRNNKNYNQSDEFSQKFLKLDVLIIDDFQMIAKKDASQEQFFNIFNDLYQMNKQIILTSDRLPSQIKTLDERLSSRLAMAGAIDLQMPSFEDKCAILKSKADFMGAEIEDEAIEFISENVKTNIRDLESEFSKLLAISDFRGISPLQVIKEGYISTAPSSNRNRTTSSKQIVEKVAKYYDLSIEEICGKSRISNIKNARQVAMYILSKELQMSTTKIAMEVGVKDHTTVMHGIKKIEADLKLNFNLRDQIADIKEKIYG